jgi:hypothetical protein
MTNNTIERHIGIGMSGRTRLMFLLRGITAEVAFPQLRLTSKAPKCSTILRREFGLHGKPASLAVQFEALLRAYGIV